MQFSLASFLLHPGGITFQGSVFPTHYCPCCQKPTMIEMGFQIVPRCPPGEGCGTRQEVGSLRSGITTALTSKDPSNPSIPKQQAINRPFVSLSLLAIAQMPSAHKHYGRLSHLGGRCFSFCFFCSLPPLGPWLHRWVARTFFFPHSSISSRMSSWL